MTGGLTQVFSTVSETKITVIDNCGRLKETQQITDGSTYTSKYTYNFAGALIEEEYPSGRVVRNEFEPDGDIARIYGIASSNAIERTYASSFSYTPDGKIEKLRLGNGLWEAAKFNTRLQTTEIAMGHGVASGDVWKLGYEYGELDPNGAVDASKNTGNIARQILSFNGLAQPFVQSYKYDSLYRLTDAKETSGISQNWIQTFGYDRYGNRTSTNQSVNGATINTTPAIDPNTNRFTSSIYHFDKNGNLDQDVTTNNQTRTTVFNGDNKQTEVRDANGTTIGRYYFDGEGKRVKKKVYDASVPTVVKEETIFVYSSGKLIAEYSTAPAPQTPTTNYTATDMLGSPRVLTNSLGEVVSRRDFLPFGEEILPDGANRTSNQKYVVDGVRQKFTGYQKDEETQLDFAEARMYENRHGRFTAVDPLLASGKSANPQTFNRYVYVSNNPILLSDPTGLDPWWRQKRAGEEGRYNYVESKNRPDGEGWDAVDFGTIGFYKVPEWNTTGRTAYLYDGGGQDFGERANYGLGDAVADTGIGVSKWGWNGMASGSEAIYGVFGRLSWEYAFTGRPREMPGVTYFEPSNQVQANAGTAMTILSFLAPGFGKSARAPVPFIGITSSETTGTGAAIQFEQYALRTAQDGMYPVMQRGSKEPVGSIFLKERDIWKYGQTMNPSSRYSGAFLDNTGAGLKFDSQFRTPIFKSVIQREFFKIVDYERQFGILPPGNKIRR